MSTFADEESDRAEGAPHPRHTSGLIGQSDHETAILDAYRHGRLPHAIILGGPQGIGKSTLAWRLTKFLAAHPDPTARAVQDAVDLGVDPTSKAAALVTSLAHPDVVLVRRELNEKSKRFYTEIRADEIRRAVSLYQRAAGAGGYRICIVDSADDLNRFSANALLKVIEEPPPSSLFLLIAHRPGLILPTIRSRARLMRLDRLLPSDIAKIVVSFDAHWRELGDDVIAAASRRAQGSVRDALRLLHDGDVELGSTVSSLLERLPSVDWREVHKLADAVAGRAGETAYETTLTTVLDWLAEQVRRGADHEVRRLAPFAEVWEKVAVSARETTALNLDKRPLILSIFSDLAAAVRAGSA